ncbi:TetR family transcriptional regulator [Plantactinospora solaniradicis]|uniref:TetR family transcriptional regulator n=1 Tax=Plantactinospora solaniradicis TaxID=1723736 RepID=A0ABW1KL59_9ACTN
MAEPVLTRAERRRQTEGRILAAARTLFAERGFERTTIRSVAAAAQVDPALVMQYFGSKQGLFVRAVQAPLVGAPMPADGPASPVEAAPSAHGTATAGRSPTAGAGRSVTEIGAGGTEELVEHLLTTLGIKIGGLPESSLAMLRSMLTHPEAAATVRTALDDQVAQLGAVIPGPDPRLRAALVITTMVGLTVGRQLLDLDALQDAAPERIMAALRPVLRVLVDPPQGGHEPPG